MSPRNSADSPRHCREDGFQLVELMFAMSILLVGILGFFFSFQSNARATRDIVEQDYSAATVTNLREYLRIVDFQNAYDWYNNSTWWIPAGLQTVTTDTVTLGANDQNGWWPRVYVEFFVNETTLPTEFGPIGDLDGDGAMSTTDCSASYVLLPCRLTLYYDDINDPDNRQHYFVLTEDS